MGMYLKVRIIEKLHSAHPSDISVMDKVYNDLNMLFHQHFFIIFFAEEYVQQKSHTFL